MWRRLRNSLLRTSGPASPPAFDKSANPDEAKASRTAHVVTMQSPGQAVWSPRDYSAFVREGYMQNPVVYRCVRLLSEAAASIPLGIFSGKEHLTDHPLKQLLMRPNGDMCLADFLEAVTGYLLISGNAYIEAVAVGNRITELHALRPDRMRVIAGSNGWPCGYEYISGGHKVRFDMPPPPATSPILHLKSFHPSNDHYGMSPVEAAATAIDIHNAASAWNKALLDNAARPSGALVFKAADATLTNEQFERLKTELDDNFQGARNAGRPLLLEGGLDWKSMGLTPRDMDFIEAKYVAAREIALALGCPPMLLGIPGDNTYANYQEANKSFWRQSVIPLATRTAQALGAWLAPAFGETIELRPLTNRLDAFRSDRDELWRRIEQADFLTTNEKRDAVGYAPLPDAHADRMPENRDHTTHKNRAARNSA